MPPVVMRVRPGAFVIRHWTLKAVGDLELARFSLGKFWQGLVRHHTPEVSLNVPEEVLFTRL